MLCDTHSSVQIFVPILLRTLLGAYNNRPEPQVGWQRGYPFSLSIPQPSALKCYFSHWLVDQCDLEKDEMLHLGTMAFRQQLNVRENISLYYLDRKPHWCSVSKCHQNNTIHVHSCSNELGNSLRNYNNEVTTLSYYWHQHFWLP